MEINVNKCEIVTFKFEKKDKVADKMVEPNIIEKVMTKVSKYI